MFWKENTPLLPLPPKAAPTYYLWTSTSTAKEKGNPETISAAVLHDGIRLPIIEEMDEEEINTR